MEDVTTAIKLATVFTNANYNICNKNINIKFISNNYE